MHYRDADRNDFKLCLLRYYLFAEYNVFKRFEPAHRQYFTITKCLLKEIRKKITKYALFLYFPIVLL